MKFKKISLIAGIIDFIEILIGESDCCPRHGRRDTTDHLVAITKNGLTPEEMQFITNDGWVLMSTKNTSSKIEYAFVRR